MHWRAKMNEVIFGTTTPAGRRFDIAVIIIISASVVAVMLESVHAIREAYGPVLKYIEWGFTALFTVEYIARVVCSARPRRYIFSFYGMIDLLAVLPTYLELLLPGVHYIAVIRVIRLLRIFRILRIMQYVRESETLALAIRASYRKILVFLFFLLTTVTVLGSLMYVIEGEERGFTSIPVSIYWGIVTLTTVGYGDISPQTALGQMVASLMMIIGYSIIAVPTGIVTAEVAQAARRNKTAIACGSCNRVGHDYDAAYCKFCGDKLSDQA